jgi:hypothetical protein
VFDALEQEHAVRARVDDAGDPPAVAEQREQRGLLAQHVRAIEPDPRDDVAEPDVERAQPAAEHGPRAREEVRKPREPAAEERIVDLRGARDRSHSRSGYGSGAVTTRPP